MPTVVWLRPVSSDARVGEQIAVVWNCVYFSPLSASFCNVGISIGPPNGDHAAKPVSSQTMNSTLGAPSGAFGCSNGVPVRRRVTDVEVDDALERLGP